jgi:bacillopeptidase F (M6 metalloprotease family)
VASKVGTRGHDRFSFTIHLYQFVFAMPDLTAVDIKQHINDTETFSKKYLRSDIIAQDYIVASPVLDFQGSNGNVLIDMNNYYQNRDGRVSGTAVDTVF